MINENELNNAWRKTAACIYKKPSDSKIFGSVELDVTDLEEYISRKRKEGLKITITHFMTLTIARALAQDIPELNVYLRRGKIIKRDSVDAAVSVLLKGGQMGSVMLKKADQLTLEEAVTEMTRQIREARQGSENKTMQSKNLISSMPWPFRNWFFRIYKTLTINWGLSIPLLNLSTRSFGSFLISNIGSLGLDMGIPALLPSSNLSLVMILGSILKKPAVVNDQIVPRKILTLGAALDHRLVDASHGGRLFRFIKHSIKNPDLLEQKPVE